MDPSFNIQQFIQQLGNLDGHEQSQVLQFIAQLQQKNIKNAPPNIFNELPESVKNYLYEHQQEAIDFLYERIIQPPNGFRDKSGGTGAVIAHNMGLGKTTTIVAFLYGILSNPAFKNHISKILIIAPVNAIQHWINEFNLKEWNNFFTTEACVCELDVSRSFNPTNPHDVRRMQIGEWYDGKQNKKILIIGYDMYDILLKDNQEKTTLKLLKMYLQNPGPDIVIFDEGHKLKNSETKSYGTKRNILTKRRILLTGTPIENDLMELFHVVKIANSEIFDNEGMYRDWYVTPIEKGKVTDATEFEIEIARKKADDLNELLKNVMHRKDSKYLNDRICVGKKEITITLCETGEQQERINEIAEAYRNAARGDKVFLRYQYDLIYLTSHPVIYDAKKQGNKKLASFDLQSKDPRRSNKMRILFEIVDTCGKSCEKLVIFAESLGTLDYIEDQLIFGKWEKNIDYFRVDGEINSRQRALFFERFNNENDRLARLFLLSTKAASVGVNLIGANRMILFDHGYNPVYNTQATYRIYRMGQKRDVYIYRFVTHNSDDCRLRRQITKESQSERTIDNKKIAPQFSSEQLKIERGYEIVETITPERIQQLQLNDPFLMPIIENNMDAIIDVTDHEIHFEEIELEDFHEESII